MKKITKIIIGVSILLLFIGACYAGEPRPLQTPYGTTGQLDVSEGIIAEETTVTEEGQVLAFNDGWNKGYFISTSKDNAADLIDTITSTGTKCRDGDIVWYHMKDSHWRGSNLPR